MLAPRAAEQIRGPGAGSGVAPAPEAMLRATSTAAADVGERFVVDVRSTLDRKVLALAAHRSQYALELELFPAPILERLLGSEHFVVARIPVESG